MKSHFDTIEKVRSNSKFMTNILKIGLKSSRDQSSLKTFSPQSHNLADRSPLRRTYRKISSSLRNYGDEFIRGNKRSLKLLARIKSKKLHVPALKSNRAYAS